MTGQPVVTPPDEFGIRLDGLKKGPWMTEAHLARQFLAPVAAVSSYVVGDWNVPLASVEGLLPRKDRSRAASIATVLRPHWSDKDGIRDPRHLEVRESLDEALTYLQLLELAVETGYLTVDAIRQEARQELAKTLWSEGARRFVHMYDYVSIGYLATRVGIDVGQPHDLPPEPDPHGAVRFATFLSGYTAWTKDGDLAEWLKFLDDYVVVDHEHELFKEYLVQRTTSQVNNVTRTARMRARFAMLHEGAIRFVDRLSTTMEPLDDNLRARFGLLYSYWLAKFFGFTLGEHGYAPGGTDWSALLEPHLVPELPDDETRDRYREAVRRRMATIERTWKVVSDLVTTRRPALGGPHREGRSQVWFRMMGSIPESFGSTDSPCVFEEAKVFYPLKSPSGAKSITAGVPYVREFARCVIDSGSGAAFSARVAIVDSSGHVEQRVVKVPEGDTDFRMERVLSQLSQEKTTIEG